MQNRRRVLRHGWQRAWLGARIGAATSGALSAIAIVVYGVALTGGSQPPDFGLATAIVFYVAIGLVVGAFIGVVFPLGRSVVGAMLIGFAAMFAVWLTVGLFFTDQGLDGCIKNALALGIAFGPALGFLFRYLVLRELTR